MSKGFLFIGFKYKPILLLQIKSLYYKDTDKILRQAFIVFPPFSDSLIYEIHILMLFSLLLTSGAFAITTLSIAL